MDKERQANVERGAERKGGKGREIHRKAKAESLTKRDEQRQ